MAAQTTLNLCGLLGHWYIRPSLALAGCFVISGSPGHGSGCPSLPGVGPEMDRMAEISAAWPGSAGVGQHSLRYWPATDIAAPRGSLGRGGPACGCTPCPTCKADSTSAKFRLPAVWENVSDTAKHVHVASRIVSITPIHEHLHRHRAEPLGAPALKSRARDNERETGVAVVSAKRDTKAGREATLISAQSLSAILLR